MLQKEINYQIKSFFAVMHTVQRLFDTEIKLPITIALIGLLKNSKLFLLYWPILAQICSHALCVGVSVSSLSFKN